MNAVRIAYIVCDLIGSLSLLGLAVAAPVWITPGYYWWTAICFLMIFAGSHAYTKRLNSWDGMGKV